jgi:hypothetical protein
MSATAAGLAMTTRRAWICGVHKIPAIHTSAPATVTTAGRILVKLVGIAMTFLSAAKRVGAATKVAKLLLIMLRAGVPGLARLLVMTDRDSRRHNRPSITVLVPCVGEAALL